VCEKRADVQVENVMTGIMAGTVNSTKLYFFEQLLLTPPSPSMIITFH